MQIFLRLVLLFAIISCHPVHAQLSADTIAMLDKIMARYTEATPGAQLAISRNGQIVYSAAKGMADLEHNVPLGKVSKTEAGSVSKQFTAAAILLLEQQGKLSLNDDVRKYIPELPDFGHTITIRHLMQHTSGIKDWGSIAEITGWPRGTKAYTNDDALHFITLQKTLNNKPGDEYIYSNSGYTLMTHIVQRLSGISHAAFTKKYIFEPAGMKNTEWRHDYKQVVKDRAIAYNKSSNNYITNMPNEDTYGHGGLLTTAEDLLAWNQYYLNGKLGGQELLTRQTALSSLNNGRRNTYAAGIVIDSLDKWKMISHSGATAGYRANLEYFPQLDLSIAWLSNTSQSDLSNTPSAARKVFVNPPSAAVNQEQQASLVDAKLFEAYAGAYKNDKTGEGIRLRIKEGSLISEQNGKLTLLAPDKALVGRAQILFHSKPRSFTMINGAGDTLLFKGVDTANVAGTRATEYAGVYTSEETESKLAVLVKDGKVYLKRRSNEILLMPVYKDGFSFPAGDLYFERDKKGRISKLYISISRARKVEFKKVD